MFSLNPAAAGAKPVETDTQVVMKIPNRKTRGAAQPCKQSSQAIPGKLSGRFPARFWQCLPLRHTCGKTQNMWMFVIGISYLGVGKVKVRRQKQRAITKGLRVRSRFAELLLNLLHYFDRKEINSV